jgi:hypothetical protein
VPGQAQQIEEHAPQGKARIHARGRIQGVLKDERASS